MVVGILGVSMRKIEVLEISGSLKSFQDDVCGADTDLLLANGRFNMSGAFQKDLSQDMEPNISLKNVVNADDGLDQNL